MLRSTHWILTLTLCFGAFFDLSAQVPFGLNKNEKSGLETLRKSTTEGRILEYLLGQKVIQNKVLSTECFKSQVDELKEFLRKVHFQGQGVGFTAANLPSTYRETAVDMVQSILMQYGTENYTSLSKTSSEDGDSSQSDTRINTYKDFLKKLADKIENQTKIDPTSKRLYEFLLNRYNEIAEIKRFAISGAFTPQCGSTAGFFTDKEANVGYWLYSQLPFGILMNRILGYYSNFEDNYRCFSSQTQVKISNFYRNVYSDAVAFASSNNEMRSIKDGNHSLVLAWRKQAIDLFKSLISEKSNFAKKIRDKYLSDFPVFFLILDFIIHTEFISSVYSSQGLKIRNYTDNLKKLFESDLANYNYLWLEDRNAKVWHTSRFKISGRTFFDPKDKDLTLPEIESIENPLIPDDLRMSFFEQYGWHGFLSDSVFRDLREENLRKYFIDSLKFSLTKVSDVQISVANRIFIEMLKGLEKYINNYDSKESYLTPVLKSQLRDREAQEAREAEEREAREERISKFLTQDPDSKFNEYLKNNEFTLLKDIAAKMRFDLIELELLLDHRSLPVYLELNPDKKKNNYHKSKKFASEWNKMKKDYSQIPKTEVLRLILLSYQSQGFFAIPASKQAIEMVMEDKFLISEFNRPEIDLIMKALIDQGVIPPI